MWLLLESNKQLLKQNRKMGEDLTALSKYVGTVPPATPPSSNTPRTPANLLARGLLKFDTLMDLWLAKRTIQSCALTQNQAKTNATRADTMGGPEWNKGWERLGN